MTYSSLDHIAFLGHANRAACVDIVACPYRLGVLQSRALADKSTKTHFPANGALEVLWSEPTIPGKGGGAPFVKTYSAGIVK